jgi:hypothetical protein
VAALFPQQLGKLVMAAIEADCARPLPVAERPKRIAHLRSELDVLHRVAARLVDADGAVHDPATPPAAVLGVSLGAIATAPEQLQLSA